MKSKLDNLDLSDENAVRAIIEELEDEIRSNESEMDDLRMEVEEADERASDLEDENRQLEKRLDRVDVGDPRGEGISAGVEECLQLAYDEAVRRFGPHSSEAGCIEGFMEAVR